MFIKVQTRANETVDIPLYADNKIGNFETPAWKEQDDTDDETLIQGVFKCRQDLSLLERE